MPELPELDALARHLHARGAGRTVAAVEVRSVAVLKTADPPPGALEGRRIEAVVRRGKHLCIHVPPLWLVLHLARAGWVRVTEAAPTGAPAGAPTDPATGAPPGARAGARRPGRSPLALRLALDDGGAFELTEAGTQKRAAAWVVHDPAEVPQLAALGADPLAADFTPERLAAVLAGAGRAQLKGVLTDQRLIAGVGNAYSDEALHAARLSPFKPAASLSPEEVARLHAALVGVLTEAVRRAEGTGPEGLKREKKAGLRVHGRDGEPCPACGDTIRSVHFADSSLQYCPRCQTGGRPLADRRLSRLLK